MDSNARSRSARYVFISILALLAMLVGFTGDKFLPITVDQDPVAGTSATPDACRVRQAQAAGHEGPDRGRSRTARCSTPATSAPSAA